MNNDMVYRHLIDTTRPPLSASNNNNHNSLNSNPSKYINCTSYRDVMDTDDGKSTVNNNNNSSRPQSNNNNKPTHSYNLRSLENPNNNVQQQPLSHRILGNIPRLNSINSTAPVTNKNNALSHFGPATYPPIMQIPSNAQKISEILSVQSLQRHSTKDTLFRGKIAAVSREVSDKILAKHAVSIPNKQEQQNMNKGSKDKTNKKKKKQKRKKKKKTKTKSKLPSNISMVVWGDRIMNISTSDNQRQSILASKGLTETNIIDQYHEDAEKEGIDQIKVSDLTQRDWLYLLHRYICNVCYNTKCDTLCILCGGGGHSTHNQQYDEEDDDSDYKCIHCN